MFCAWSAGSLSLPLLDRRKRFLSCAGVATVRNTNSSRALTSGVVVKFRPIWRSAVGPMLTCTLYSVCALL